MKTTIFNKKALAFFGAAAILLAAVFTTGCKTDAGSGDPAPEMFTVEMTHGEHGTVTANPAIPAGGKVAKDTVITFTAAPASGYKVDKWTITGGAFETGTGTDGSTTAKVKITANTKVNVSFKTETITPPSPTEFTVEMTAGEHGTLSSNPVIPAGGKVAKVKVITFTATPADRYGVDKWTITGGTFEAGTGTEGSLTAKVKITANTKVNVSFTPTEFTVEMTHGEHGTLSADPAIPAGGKVAKDTVITFTATPASGYKVDKWTITGGTFETGTDTEGSLTAKVKITAKTKVNVSFKTETITPPSPTEFTVEMTHGEHGTVIANPAIPAGGKVAKDTVITFTADPASGYKVDKWTITGGTFETGTGTEGSLTAKVKITADTKVNVSFTPTAFTVEMTHGEHGNVTANPAIPAGGKVAKDTVITFTADPASGYKVDKWTITVGTFEAGTGTDGSTTAKVKITADTKVNVSFISMYAIVPLGINGAVLDNHLKNAAPDTDGIYYIEVTGLTAADLKGKYTYPLKPSALGKILNDNPTKKVALKLSEVSGLTDMSYCFYGCESLIQAPAIPSGVTDMSYCFYRCKSLTQAPVIPSGVTYMSGCFFGCTSLTQAPEIPSAVTKMTNCFCGCTSLTQAPVIPSGVTDISSCFFGCTSLIQAPVIPSTVTKMKQCFSGCESLIQAPVIPSTVTKMDSCFYGCKKITAVTLKCDYVEGKFGNAFYGCETLIWGNSIKVPSGQLSTYKANAAKMDAQENWFVAE